MEKIKILFLITKDNFGGAQKYVFELAKNLKSKNLNINNKLFDFDILVASGYTNNTSNKSGELDQKLQIENIQTTKVISLNNSLNIIKLIIQIKDTLKVLHKENPNIIHINSSMAGVCGVIATKIFNITKKFKRQRKTIIVFTAHGWPFNEKRNVLNKIVFKVFLYLVILLSDKIIAVSNQIKNDINKVLHHKFKIIYNGIDYTKTKNKDNNNILNKTNLKENKIHLISIGELHPVKGHDLIIKALAKIKSEGQTLDFVYHILGEGHYRETLENIAKTNNIVIGQDIIFYGYIKNARDYIQNADIFIMPSYSEALGFALIEGYNSGLPIIQTNVGGMIEVKNIYQEHLQSLNKSRAETIGINNLISNTETVVYKNKHISINPDPEEFYKILDNKILIQELIKQKTESLDKIPQEFQIKTMLQDTINLYKTLLEKDIKK